MTYFKVTEKQLDEYGKVFPEYDKWDWQTGRVTWVPLLVGPNRVKRFALSNLKEVEMPFDSGMLYTCAEPPPMVIYPMPDMFPRDVFLGIANGILELANREVDIRIAVADGQLPKAA